MVIPLALSDYSKVRHLFEGLEYNLTIAAVIDGLCPGKIWVDEAETPRAAFIYTVEGCGLGGDCTRQGFLDDVARLIQTDLFINGTLREGETELDIRITPEWEAALRNIATQIERPSIPWKRLHYTCRELMLTDWRERLPEGFSVQAVDGTLLDRTDIAMPAHTLGWYEANWGSRDNYLKHGFGWCMIHEEARAVVAWCLADCISGDGCEIGIHTAPEYRRRGLAALTVAAAVESALSHGYKQAGWHCNAENIGSVGVAEKVGFEKERDYFSYVHMADLGDHHTVQAFRHSLDRDYPACIAAMDRAFALRDGYPYYVYFLAAQAEAAAGDPATAMTYLNRAVDEGEDRVELLLGFEPFQRLHGSAAWDSVLGRLRDNQAA